MSVVVAAFIAASASVILWDIVAGEAEGGEP